MGSSRSWETGGSAGGPGWGRARPTGAVAGAACTCGSASTLGGSVRRAFLNPLSLCKIVLYWWNLYYFENEKNNKIGFYF